MSNTLPRTIEWLGELDGFVRMIDQTKLPGELVMVDCQDATTVWEAIKRLSVRGAPAIGVAGAMGVVLGVRHVQGPSSAVIDEVDRVCDYLATSRPTAVNLFWAIKRMRKLAHSLANSEASSIKNTLLAEAKCIRDEDAAMCQAIGQHGEPLIKEDSSVLTHCNAGSLATSEFGTALAPMYAAHKLGRKFKVYSCETRPLLQGARLTCWELTRAGLDVTLLCDSAAGSLMASGNVSLVITGADCIAANGDVANKVGTFPLALLAQFHKIPFYVAAPSSTFDLAKKDGSMIPIEQRGADEIRCGFSQTTAPEAIPCYNPAFDLTPSALIGGIITEKGIIKPVTAENIARQLG